MPIPPLRETNFRIRKIGQRVRQRSNGHTLKQRPNLSATSRWKRWVKRALPAVAILFIMGVISLLAAFAWVSRDLPDPNKISERAIAQSTKIYASDGTTLLYEIHGDENRTLVQLEDIPDYVKEATIAIEDKDFYSHQGFDLPGIAKAVCHEIFGNLGGLCPQRGGSTITQQFVKNSLLTSEHSYTRKLKELILAYQLEQKFSKDQILQLYLNEIPYGSTAYGVESAAHTFLGKSISDVTLSEAAFLAALPQRPSYLSPYGNHVDDLSARLHVVLNQMVDQGYITEEEAAVAKEDNILARLKPKYENIIAPHFVLYVKEQLSNKYGEKVLEQGGLKVITTLNIDKQRIAEEAIEKYGNRNATKYNASNAALVSLDTKTGQILAMVGSRDYFNDAIDGQVNVVLRPRQPGSSFKPIVYLTAFARGYTDQTILFDLVTKFKTAAADYEPKNYDLTERGPITMRQALAGSLNIPAVKTLYLAGIDNVLDTANQLGYTTFQDRSRFGLSLVLGGGEVTLLEHTSAFATLAREGVKHPVVSILRVEDAKGKILEEYEEREEQVSDTGSIRLLNNILSDDAARAYVFGSGSNLTLPGRPVAAKTGTTNDYRDAWTIGYTPSFATGVWVGNNDNSEMRRGAAGAVVAAPIWHEYMSRTVGGPIEPFKQPAPNNADKPVLQGHLEGELPLKVDKVTGKVIPVTCLADWPKSFIEEKTYRVVHTILYYVNREDPRGPAPDDPSIDPQYERWEEPVRRWAKQNGYIDNKPANEDCSLRAKENFPTITITSPKNNSTISTAQITVNVTTTTAAKRSIKNISYYLDDKLIKTVTKKPYSLSYKPTSLKNGFHDLSAVITDDIDNTGRDVITINYLLSKKNKNTNTLNPNVNNVSE